MYCEDQKNEEDAQYRHSNTEEIALPDVGDGSLVYWTMDNQFYEGLVYSVNENNIQANHYDDGDIKELIIHQRNWRP